MLFELREYRVWPGQRENWVKFMEEVIVPFQVSKGMVIVASFVGEEEGSDLYVWIRRFEDEQEREKLYAAVYENDRWQNEILPRVRELIDREKMVITRLVPTPKSMLR